MIDRTGFRCCVVALISLTLLTSCRRTQEGNAKGASSDTPGATYHNPTAALRLNYPTSWTKLEHGERGSKALVAFLSSPDQKGDRQHLAFDVQKLSEDVTLEQMKDAAIAQAKEVFPRFELISSEKTTFGGREAWRTTYLAGTDRGSARITQILALANTNAYSVIYTARTEAGFERSLPEAEQIIASAKIEE